MLFHSHSDLRSYDFYQSISIQRKDRQQIKNCQSQVNRDKQEPKRKDKIKLFQNQRLKPYSHQSSIPHHQQHPNQRQTKIHRRTR